MAVVDDIAKEHNQLELNYACLSCTKKDKEPFQTSWHTAAIVPKIWDQQVEEVMKNIKNNSKNTVWGDLTFKFTFRFPSGQSIFHAVLMVKLPPPDPFNGTVLNFQQNDCVRYANRVR